MSENEHEFQAAYQINGSMLLHQEENEHGVEYTLFDFQTKKEIANGLISWLDLPDDPGPSVMACVRERAMDEVGLKVQSVAKVPLLMNEMEGIIGQVSWLCPPEEKFFTDVDAFLNMIREELPYFNTSGFKYKVLTDDPEVRQAADRIVLEFFDMVEYE